MLGATAGFKVSRLLGVNDRTGGRPGLGDPEEREQNIVQSSPVEVIEGRGEIGICVTVLGLDTRSMKMLDDRRHVDVTILYRIYILVS